MAMLVESSLYTYDHAAEHARLLREGDHILEVALATLDYPKTEAVELEDFELKTEQAILNEVERRGAHLVVMSTHGRSGLAHLFLGSVAEGVLKSIRVPLLLIQSPERVLGHDTTDRAAPREAVASPIGGLEHSRSGG